MKPAWRTVFLVAVLVGVLWLGYLARAVVTPLIVAVLLAYVLDPVVRKLQGCRLSRSAASAFVVITTLLVIGGLGGWGSARAVTEIDHFVKDVVGEPLFRSNSLAEKARLDQTEMQYRETPILEVQWLGETQWFLDVDRDGKFRPGLARQTSEKVTELLKQNPWTEKLAEQVGKTVEPFPLVATSITKWVQQIFETGGSVAGAALSLVTLLVLFPIYLYYSLSELPRLYAVVVQHLPGPHRDRIVEILLKIHVTLAAFFRGRFILLVIRFVFLLSVFIAFDVPFGAVCAAFGTAASLVPILGSVASIAVPLALAVASGASGGSLLGLLIVMAAYEGVEQYVLTPAVVGRSVGLHPLTILVGTLVAGELLGIFGMVVAIPILAVIKILWSEFVMPELRRHAGLTEPPRKDVPPPPAAPVTPATPT